MAATDLLDPNVLIKLRNIELVARAVVDGFLAEHPDYPVRLRGKILQSADGVRRAARIVYGPQAAPEWRVYP